MKANGHSVFEEIGEFVNALDIYHILAADTEEQIGIQLLFQVTQRLIDGYKKYENKIFEETNTRDALAEDDMRKEEEE